MEFCNFSGRKIKKTSGWDQKNFCAESGHKTGKICKLDGILVTFLGKIRKFPGVIVKGSEQNYLYTQRP